MVLQKKQSRLLLFDDNYAQKWNFVPGSIDRGDTLKVVKGNEELNIKLCGIAAPEIEQPQGN